MSWKIVSDTIFKIITILLTLFSLICIQRKQVEISDKQFKLSKIQFDTQKNEKLKLKHIQPLSIRLLKYKDKEVKEKVVFEKNSIKKVFYVNAKVPHVKAEILSGVPKRAKILNIASDYFVPYVHLYSKKDMDESIYNQMVNTTIPLTIKNIDNKNLFIPFYSQIESTSGEYKLILCLYKYSLTENENEPTNIEIFFFDKNDINWLLESGNKETPIVYLYAYQELEKKASGLNK
ncbi:hypothetical protein [Carnobacterium divergens]|uniref:hypothetical protein n=1 Tax=Carnobacterium divergens TaxID=2748 RepID=UPI0039AF5169